VCSETKHRIIQAPPTRRRCRFSWFLSPQSGPLCYPAVRARKAVWRMTTYELFLCWIIIMLLVLVVGEASIIKVGVAQRDTAAQFDRRALINDVAAVR